jgi:hypothetical protein
MTTNHDPITELSTDELSAMTLVAASNLVAKWLPQVPAAQDHVAAGAGLVLEVTLTPEPGLRLMLVDSDGQRYPLAWRESTH